MIFSKAVVASFICAAFPVIAAFTSGEEISKVIGGLTANKDEFPYNAIVMRDGEFRCGASILSNKFVLTAAHCAAQKKLFLFLYIGTEIADTASRYKIAVGVYDKENLSGSNVQNLTVKNIIMHEKFVASTNENDIAILELENEIQFNSHAQPVKLPESNENFTGNALVSGWGWNDWYRTTLQKLEAPIVSNDKCRLLWSGYRRITNKMLCFGEKGKDACRGDSGSPMMCLRNDTTYVQCGIVSFGKPCNSSWLPGVQTRVASYIPWIEEKMGGNLGNNATSLTLKQRIDQAEPLTSKSAEFLLKLAYEVKEASPNNSTLKSRFPKSIQHFIWNSACHIKNVETGHYMKVVMERQMSSNGSTIQVFHMVGEATALNSISWKLVPEMTQDKLHFKIHNGNVNKFMDDQKDEGFVQDGAFQYEIHFENDRVPSSIEQQPFYIFNPNKNVYFYEAKRGWEKWRCGFNQFLDCLVPSQPGAKYDEGKFILEGCIEESAEDENTWVG